MITVFGLGFVGLTTALGFAHYGFKVKGVDIDDERKDIIRNGGIPFLEKNLDVVLKDTLNITFYVEDDTENALKDSEIIFYCVGTPYGENGQADLTYLFKAIDETLEHIDKDKKMIFVIKSTVPPSTTREKIIPYIEGKGFKQGTDIIVANNPEFLREGYCWEDFICGDRIIIGCESEKGISELNKIYQPFNIPVYNVNWSTAEFIKYLSNTLLATMISYSNEMTEIADLIGGIDISKSFQILHMDKRWNNCNMATYVYPGCGYGGYCLPKDTNALYRLAKSKGMNPKILENVIKINDDMPSIIANKIQNKVNKSQKIGILGLSFKPESDDVRDCASAKIIKQLDGLGYKHIIGYDPVANEIFKSYYELDMDYAHTLEEIIEVADVLIILTAWGEFKDISTRTNKLILDYRYMDKSR